MPRVDLKILSVSQPSLTFRRAEHFIKGVQEDACDPAMYSTYTYLNGISVHHQFRLFKKRKIQEQSKKNLYGWVDRTPTKEDNSNL